MKCVMNNLTLEVKRVSDENAERLVAKNDYKYCPKSEWKALRVAPVVAIVHTEDQLREIARKADKRKDGQAKKNYRAGK